MELVEYVWQSWSIWSWVIKQLFEIKSMQLGYWAFMKNENLLY